MENYSRLNGRPEYRYQGTDELGLTVFLKNYNEHICSLFSNFSRGSKFLDFGAGIGVLATIMSRKNNICCLEPDLSMGKHLRALGFEVYDFSEQIPSESFSYVFSSNVLEHTRDDESVLREIYRILEPGGRLALYLPAFQVLWSEMDAHVGHFRRYTKKIITEKINRTGFRSLDSFYVDSLGFIATLLYKRKKVYQPPTPSMLKFYDSKVFPVSKFIDGITRVYFGKNVFVIVEKPV